MDHPAFSGDLLRAGHSQRHHSVSLGALTGAPVLVWVGVVESPRSVFSFVRELGLGFRQCSRIEVS